MKLWTNKVDLNNESAKIIESFTIGNDREYDKFLALPDFYCNCAQAIMLNSIGLISDGELDNLKNGLNALLRTVKADGFSIPIEFEDIHSFQEFYLTEKCGDVGKKIHTGRSRNDQVVTDLRIWQKLETEILVNKLNKVIQLLLKKAEQYQHYMLPGLTHTQIAMPSSFGMWFCGYAEALIDSLILLKSSYDFADSSPLGTGAGYGSSFAIDRTLTAKLLGFSGITVNPINAQLNRGKTERIFLSSLSSIAEVVNRFAADVILFSSGLFRFILLDQSTTTGSSIMPQKRNPDVFELLRAKCNQVISGTYELQQITTNLISGYHRDFQLTKEVLFRCYKSFLEILEILPLAIESIQPQEINLEDKKYYGILAVEAVNNLVSSGMPFRDAYLRVKTEIEDGNLKASKAIHTHIGSIDNLGINILKDRLNANIKAFNFEDFKSALQRLEQSLSH